MTRRTWNVAAIAPTAVLALAVAACGPDVDDRVGENDAPYRTPVAGDTSGTPGAGTGAGTANYDTDIDGFLTDYIREDEMFADNDLDYDVSNGQVTVRGTVDSEAERNALDTRIDRVPGVQGVDVANVDIRAGS